MGEESEEVAALRASLVDAANRVLETVSAEDQATAERDRLFKRTRELHDELARTQAALAKADEERLKASRVRAIAEATWHEHADALAKIMPPEPEDDDPDFPDGFTG